MIMNYYIAVFQTKNQAMFLCSELEAMGYSNFQLISTPCIIKAGCNYAIKFGDNRLIDLIVEEAQVLNIGTPSIYSAKKQGGKYVYKKIAILEH